MLTRDDIVNKLGIENSNIEEQDRILQKVANAVSTRIMLKLSEKLTDQDLDEIARMMDSGSETDVESLIISKVPNYDNFKNEIEEGVITELENNAKAIDAMAKSENLDKLEI
ncbi:MAG: DUF5663 domain-containing protein [Candidatus Saccharibacteria bacterium]